MEKREKRNEEVENSVGIASMSPGYGWIVHSRKGSRLDDEMRTGDVRDGGTDGDFGHRIMRDASFHVRRCIIGRCLNGRVGLIA